MWLPIFKIWSTKIMHWQSTWLLFLIINAFQMAILLALCNTLSNWNPNLTNNDLRRSSMNQKKVQYTTIIVFFRVYSFTNIVTNKSFWSVRGRTSTLTSFFNIRKLCNYNVRLVLWFVLHGMKIKQLFELKNFQMPTLQFLNNGCNFAVIITSQNVNYIFILT